MRFDHLPFGRSESLGEPSVIATYAADQLGWASALERAGRFAVGQTVGTWISVPGVSDDMVTHYQGRVLGVYDAGPAEAPSFLLRIAFPAANFGGSLTMLLTALLGNDVSTALRARLIDLELACGADKLFEGPRQGMDELRRLTGVTGRPLVLNMIKPCAGFSPKEGAGLFYQAAMGGIDLIKDDELLASPDYNDVRARFAAYRGAARAAYEKTGRETLYLPNISGAPTQMLDNAAALVEAGAKACLVNFVFGGLDALGELARRFGDKLFIMAHYAGVGAFCSRACGVSNAVFLGLLPRLAGAHAVMTMTPPPGDAYACYDFRKTVQAQRLPLGGLRPVVTAVGGGVTPCSQAAYQRELGPDCIIGIGGAVQGHPMGTTEGARAAMAAVQATADGVPLAEAAQRCEALGRAIDLWGAPEGRA